MRLTWRDGVTTILAGCTVAIAMAVAQGWGWPLLGSVAAGVAVLGAVGLAMCVLGASTDSAPSLKDPFTAVMSVLGSVALVLIVVGLIMANEAVFMTLTVVILVMWLVSTTSHAISARPSLRYRVHSG